MGLAVLRRADLRERPGAGIVRRRMHESCCAAREGARQLASDGGVGSGIGLASMGRRGAIGLMAAGAVGYALLGPKGARQAPRGRVVIDYWEKWTGQEGLAMERLVDAFNASQDRIWVRYFSMAAVDQKAAIAIAAGDPPDLLGLWNFSIPSFSATNAIQPLDGLIEAHGAAIARRFAERYGDRGFPIVAERYAEPAWDLVNVGGRLWGVVNTCSSMALVYDRGAFRAAGLDPDAPPRTIEELDAASERLTTYDGAGKLVRAGFHHREPGWWNWIWGYWFGGHLIDRDTGDPTATDPRNVAGYEWVQGYPERYGASRLISFQSGFGNYNSAQQPLLAGKVAMALHGPFLANVVKTFAPAFDYGSAPFPVAASVYDPEAPIGLLESDMLCIPAGARHPEEALEFIAFTQRTESVEALAIRHAKPSPLARDSAEFERRHPHRWIGVHNKIVRSARAFPKPPTIVWPQYEDEFNAAIGAFWQLERPASEILSSIQARAEGFTEAARRRRGKRGGAGT